MNLPRKTCEILIERSQMTSLLLSNRISIYTSHFLLERFLCSALAPIFCIPQELDGNGVP